MPTNRPSPTCKPVWMISAIALSLLSGCASHQPIKCEYPSPPASLMRPQTQDQIQKLGKIFDRDWSNTDETAKP